MKNDQKIESVLNSLDGMERAHPRPFFFTRLEARMERQDGFEKVIRFISRPVVVIVAVMLIILVNAYTIFMSMPTSAQNNTTSSELASIDEYIQLSSNNMFDTDKSNP